MDLLKILIPAPAYFHIVLDNNEKIRVEEYRSIKVDFIRGGTYVNGIDQNITNPMITYEVVINDEDKGKLKYLYRNEPTSAWGTIHNRPARISLSKDKYIFRADIMAKPNISYSRFSGPDYEWNQYIKIQLKLEHTNISLFEDIKIAYKKYEKVMSRFELMDL